MSDYGDVTWLHRFINCTPFGADAPTEDIARAQRIVERLGGDLSAARRELAEARGAIDILRGLVALKDRKESIGKDDTYNKMQPELWQRAREFLRALKSPVQGKTITAPQVPDAPPVNGRDMRLTQPAAAVTDDPVAVYTQIRNGTQAGHVDALHNLARHYEARGMRKAAEIAESCDVFSADEREIYGSILSAAAELERKL